ncbi:MAG TPA: anti-sigma regulatory factor, partial [Paraburkholderia sp.]
MTTPIERIPIATEVDVVAARRKARTIAAALGFSLLDQTRIASAVSEIARNAFEYARGGTVTFAFDGASRPQAFTIEVRDEGPGIRDLEAVLDGSYRSATGMGRGIAGCFQLMDRCHVESAPGRGTTVTMARALPAEHADIPASRLDTLMRGLREPAAVPANATQRSLEEVQAQNRELLSTLTALRDRQDELLRLTEELEATNR